jgi:ABC-type uncharacterized transport system ATPase subunit
LSVAHAPTAGPPESGPLLRADSIEVVLGGTRILNGASIEVARGEIHVLIGPNGAGKTTLANVLTGHVKPVSGRVELAGERLTGFPWQRARRGVGRKFQVPRVFSRLTAEQNLMVAARRAGSGGPDIDQMSTAAIASQYADELSHGWRQRLEMQMVLSQRPAIAVLDEPTAGMPKGERQEFAQLLIEQRGRTTFLIVEHDMDFVEAVADTVSFMHDGRVTASGSFAEISRNPTVREIYLGVRHRDAVPSEPVL